MCIHKVYWKYMWLFLLLQAKGTWECTCTICRVDFTRYYFATRHTQETHSGFTYSCLKCSKVFSTRNYKHGCNVKNEDDFDIIFPIGARGREGRKAFDDLIRLRRISDLGYITAPHFVPFYDTHGDTEDTFST